MAAFKQSLLYHAERACNSGNTAYLNVCQQLPSRLAVPANASDELQIVAGPRSTTFIDRVKQRYSSKPGAYINNKTALELYLDTVCEVLDIMQLEGAPVSTQPTSRGWSRQQAVGTPSFYCSEHGWNVSHSTEKCRQLNPPNGSTASAQSYSRAAPHVPHHAHAGPGFPAHHSAHNFTQAPANAMVVKTSPMSPCPHPLVILGSVPQFVTKGTTSLLGPTWSTTPAATVTRSSTLRTAAMPFTLRGRTGAQPQLAVGVC
jgi:hypothetical protein